MVSTQPASTAFWLEQAVRQQRHGPGSQRSQRKSALMAPAFARCAADGVSSSSLAKTVDASPGEGVQFARVCRGRGSPADRSTGRTTGCASRLHGQCAATAVEGDCPDRQLQRGQRIGGAGVHRDGTDGRNTPGLRRRRRTGSRDPAARRPGQRQNRHRDNRCCSRNPPGSRSRGAAHPGGAANQPASFTSFSATTGYSPARGLPSRLSLSVRFRPAPWQSVR